MESRIFVCSKLFFPRFDGNESGIVNIHCFATEYIHTPAAELLLLFCGGGGGYFSYFFSGICFFYFLTFNSYDRKHIEEHLQVSHVGFLFVFSLPFNDSYKETKVVLLASPVSG